MALLAAVSVVVAAALIFVMGSEAEPRAASVLVTTTTTDAPPSSTTTAAPEPDVPVAVELATPIGEIPTFDAPGGEQVGTAGFWYGFPQTMPILERQGGWMRIMLPEKPNGKTGWVQVSDVTTSSTEYRVVIDLSETRLIVYKDGFPAFDMPAGIGKDSTPTPTGHFYVGVKSDPGLPGYGRVVLDSTGHSEAIESWQGSGDAIIAIHGQLTTSSAERIGTTGTKLSNGCIRLHFADQERLDVIPAGAPVDIID